MRIGGSEAAAACGLDPYLSRVALWLDKTGRQARPEAGEAAEWGKRLEPVLRDALLELHDVDALPWHNDATALQYGWTEPDHLPSWVKGTPDGIAFDMASKDYGLAEFKTCGLRGAHEWDDDRIPVKYQCQAMHYMALTGARWTVFGCLIGGQEFVTRRLEFDDAAWNVILRLETEFVGYVERDECPPADGSESTDAALKILYPDAKPTTVELPPAEFHRIEQLRKLKDAVKACEVEYDRACQELKLMMRDAAYLQARGVTVATWKESSRTGVDLAKLESDYPDAYSACKTTTTFRRFSVK